jgi:RNA 2',3'-cyclic 3'-phosphodiesterase
MTTVLLSCPDTAHSQPSESNGNQIHILSIDNHAPRKRRLFVGIALDEHARTACAAVAQELRESGFSAKYEAPAKLHVTLAFLGFVDSGRIDTIAAELTSCAARSSPFEVRLDKLGAFPHERRPRVVYVGARQQGASFRALAADLRDRYAALGFEFKNDAVAHVTIARTKASKRTLPLIEFSPFLLRIASLVLFESLPDPANKTSRYVVTQRAGLGG